MPRRMSESEIDAKRKHILDAARTLFVQKGFAETTMTQIARQANMPISSLYNYFGNKEDIFRHSGLGEEFLAYRPEWERRRRAILDVALKQMGKNGYAAVTLDEIATTLKMPKASFYQFFESKEALFSALLTESPLQEKTENLDMTREDPLCISGLREVGRSYLAMGDMPERTAIFRMAVHESSDNPDTGRLFYSEGISKVCDTLAQYIKTHLRDAPLSDADYKLAAWIFLSSLWASNILFKVIVGAERDFSDEQILDMSVEIMRAWLEKQEHAADDFRAGEYKEAGSLP